MDKCCYQFVTVSNATRTYCSCEELIAIYDLSLTFSAIDVKID